MEKNVSALSHSVCVLTQTFTNEDVETHTHTHEHNYTHKCTRTHAHKNTITHTYTKTHKTTYAHTSNAINIDPVILAQFITLQGLKSLMVPTWPTS